MEVWIFSKALDELVEGDLVSLIVNRVRESVTLEYKRQMYGTSSDERRKMVRDVAALANAEGGAIILGMDEDDDGVARELVPVGNAEVEASRLISSCNASIAERIRGLRTVPIPIQNNGVAIVVYIPRSYRKPHMISADGRTDFWIRHDRQNAPMSIAEIRAAITLTEDLSMRAEQFIRTRHQWIVNKAMFGILGAPLSLEEGRVDISDLRLTRLLRDPPTAPGAEALGLLQVASRVRPSLRGRGVHSDEESLEVFRSGHVEFLLTRSRVLQDVGNRSLLGGGLIASYLANFLRFIGELRELASIADPYLITVSLAMPDVVTMNERGTWALQGLREAQWHEGQDLFLGPVLAPHDESPSLAPKVLGDLLWNAFHFEACPFIDKQGNVSALT